MRFVRGLVDSTDLPMNVSREKIQESPILAAIKKGVTSRVISDLEKFARQQPDAYIKTWDTFGTVLKEGLYEDFERRDALLALARFKTTAASGTWRSLKDYTAAALKENQTAIYYIVGDDIARLEASPHLEGIPRARGRGAAARGSDRQLLGHVRGIVRRQAVQVGHAGRSDLALIPRVDATPEPAADTEDAVKNFLTFIKDDAQRRRGGGARFGSADGQRGLPGRP